MAFVSEAVLVVQHMAVHTGLSNTGFCSSAMLQAQCHTLSLSANGITWDP